MKKVITAIFSLALVTCLIVYSCQKDKEDNSAKTNSTEAKASSKSTVGADLKLGWSPLNSKIKEVNGGLQVIAPVGWEYIGYDKNHKVVQLGSQATKTINCTCNTSGTCKPFKSDSPFGSTQGCVGTCTNCTMTQSGGKFGRILDIEEGGYYMPGAQTRVLNNGESIPAVFDALLQLDRFQNEYSKFMKKAYQGKELQRPVYLEDGSVTAPKGHSLVAISIMGRGMGVILPDEFVISQLGYAASSKASCDCSSSGNCELKSKSVGIAGAYWCEGSCNSCTLTTSRFSLPDFPLKEGIYEVTLKAYAY